VSFTVERQTKQKEERKQLSALYINPFLLACQELQSRLYNILDDGNQPTAWNRGPGGTSMAEETFYLVAQYFGWERRIFRYGPYAQDTEVFQRTEAIRATFATNRVGVYESTEERSGAEPFCFYRYQQKALAQIILESSEGPAGTEAETVTYFDFRKRLSALLDSLPSVGATLEALGDADFPQKLDPLVRGRLIEVQNHLVMLLAYLEKKEGFTLSFGKRDTIIRDPDWIEWAKDRGWDTLLSNQDQTTP
jgi:hypothetical protein